MIDSRLVKFVNEFTKKPVRFAELYPEENKMLLETTAFLPMSSSVPQRFWHIRNNMLSIPVCPICMIGELKWNNTTKDYRQFCCRECAAKDPNRVAKQQSTMMDRYGVTSWSQTEESKNVVRTSALAVQARKNTIEKTYGSHDSYKQHLSQVAQKNYNQLSAEETAARQKLRKCRMIEKYGVEHPMQSDEIKRRQRDTMVDRYGVMSYHQNMMSIDTINRLRDSDWLINQHHVLRKTQQQIASELGVDPTTIGRVFDKLDIDKRYFYGSAEQRSLAEWLKAEGLTVLENQRILDGKELDILLPDLNIAIEYCGIYWHCDIHDRITSKTHADKYNECKKRGIRLITLFQNEWLEKQELVKNKIRTICKIAKCPKIGARTCTVRCVEPAEKNAFHNQHHIQGTDKSTVAYGLYDKSDTLVACLSGTLTKNTLNITRYSSIGGVMGGFSKLLKHTEQVLKITETVTFADLRWSDGDLYLNNGFVADKMVEPTFYYYDNKKKKVLHRSNYMKHKLIEQYGFDATMTEFQMCDSLGLLRIWDCGKIKFVKRADKDEHPI